MKTQPAKRSLSACEVVAPKNGEAVAAHTEPIRSSAVQRVPLTQVRDAAWQVPEEEPSIEVVEQDLLHRILSRKKNAADTEQREKLLGLLCRPIGQRGRMQKHWNGDPADIEATHILFGPVLAGEIMRAISPSKDAFGQTEKYPFIDTAIDYVKDTVARMQPRDELERMLIEQSLWLHARIARLSVQAANSTGEKSVRTLSEAADRATNAFRRHMQALKDYRSARKPKVFMPIRSAHIGNVAGQQVVNASGGSRNRFFRFLRSCGTKRNLHAIDTPAVPAITAGTGSEAGEHPTHEAVAADAGPDHTSR
ncbi:MAG TPA: hypothetical protein VLC46_24950 [Thermoanaerobaculia bacterium]|jgi:hypothetical protein|nr:hypothetical protein [Thermoanaerobaculia bacterium]